MAGFVLEDRGVIYDAGTQPAETGIAFFTGLCGLRNGDWLCGYQVGSAKNSPDSTIQLSCSSDGGKTWNVLNPILTTAIDGVPGSLSTPAMVEIEDGRLLLVATWYDRSDPDRPLFDPETQGILHSRILLAESSDGGSIWSEWRILPTPGLRGCAVTGEIVRWEDGSIAVSFESYREFDDPEPQNHAAWTIVSRDGGATFSKPLLIAQHPEHRMYYWDQRLCAAGEPGDFAALFWTHDLQTERDLNVHVRYGRINGESIAVEDMRETSIQGQIAASLILSDGRLLAFVVDRCDPCTMTLWQSDDRGQTWPEQSKLVIHTHDEKAAVTPGNEPVDFNEYWEDMGKWSFGHPSMKAINETQILCAFYAGTPDCMSIHWGVVNV